MLELVEGLTILLALTSLLKVVYALSRRNSASVPRSVFLEQKRKNLLQGMVTFWFSTAAFLFLLTGHGTPVEVLIALALCLALAYPLASIKGGLRLVSGEEGSKALAIARDPGTGEEFGLVVGQVKEPQSDKIKGYRIKTKGGELIEKPVDAVVVEIR